jgi:hypothetical protein
MNGAIDRSLNGNPFLDPGDPLLEVFSEAWMCEYARLWNAEQAMVRELTRHRFSAVVGYGFLDQPAPQGLLVVVRGIAEWAGPYDGRELDWDLRAAPLDWTRLLNQGFELTRLLAAVGGNRLQIWKGNHRRILRKPPLISPLLRAFALMPEVRIAERPSVNP